MVTGSEGSSRAAPRATDAMRVHMSPTTTTTTLPAFQRCRKSSNGWDTWVLSARLGAEPWREQVYHGIGTNYTNEPVILFVRCVLCWLPSAVTSPGSSEAKDLQQVMGGSETWISTNYPDCDDQGSQQRSSECHYLAHAVVWAVGQVDR